MPYFTTILRFLHLSFFFFSFLDHSLIEMTTASTNTPAAAVQTTSTPRGFGGSTWRFVLFTTFGEGRRSLTSVSK